MKPNKNIDRLFQEKLRDLEVSPPKIVWDAIESRLDTKKKRRLLPLWFRYAGVAALLLLATLGGVNYFSTSPVIQEIENSISDTDFKPNTIEDTLIEEDATISSSSSSEEATSNEVEPNAQFTVPKEQLNSDNAIVSSEGNVQQQQNLASSVESQKEANGIADIAEPSIDNSNSNLGATNTSEPQTSQIAIADIATDTETETVQHESEGNMTQEEQTEDAAIAAYGGIENLEDTLENNLTEDFEEDQSDLSKRWTIASVVAPVFYNSFSTRGAPLDLQFQNNPKSGSQSFSYGVRVGYNIGKKFVIQSGLTVMDVGYTVGDIYVNPSPQVASRLANVSYSNSGTILNVNANITDQVVIETGEIQDPITGTLNQDYGYIEVPLEMKYNLSNGKLGVHIVAGFSTLFLDSNEVYVETNSFSSELGEANNLNSVNFSGNFGMDLDYFINSNLFINVNPMIKVHTNTFTENIQNFEPYVIGIYTGLNYRF